jgi:hypothetical protein
MLQTITFVGRVEFQLSMFQEVILMDIRYRVAEPTKARSILDAWTNADLRISNMMDLTGRIGKKRSKRATYDIGGRDGVENFRGTGVLHKP